MKLVNIFVQVVFQKCGQKNIWIIQNVRFNRDLSQNAKFRQKHSRLDKAMHFMIYFHMELLKISKYWYPYHILSIWAVATQSYFKNNLLFHLIYLSSFSSRFVRFIFIFLQNYEEKNCQANIFKGKKKLKKEHWKNKFMYWPLAVKYNVVIFYKNNINYV